jgi:hypothetical protein
LLVLADLLGEEGIDDGFATDDEAAQGTNPIADV